MQEPPSMQKTQPVEETPSMERALTIQAPPSMQPPPSAGQAETEQKNGNTAHSPHPREEGQGRGNTPDSGGQQPSPSPIEKKQETETAGEKTTPSSVLSGMIRTVGAKSRANFEHFTRLATEQPANRKTSEKKETEPGTTPDTAIFSDNSSRAITALDKTFRERLTLADRTTHNKKTNDIRLFHQSALKPAHTLLMYTRGEIAPRQVLENITHWKLSQITGQTHAPLQILGGMLCELQKRTLSLGFSEHFINQNNTHTHLQITDAMSKLALTDILADSSALPLPSWMKGLLEYQTATLNQAATLIDLGHTYFEARRKGTISDDLETILSHMDIEIPPENKPALRQKNKQP